MMTQIRIVAAVVLLFATGCNTQRRVMRQVERDSDRLVENYRVATADKVERILMENLKLTSEYDRKGWGQLGNQGWLEWLNAMTHTRLAIYYRETGNSAGYRTHMDAALACARQSKGKDILEDRLVSFVRGLDKHINPRWKDELANQAAQSTARKLADPGR